MTVTQAATSPLSSVSYTCYDKAGHVLREIRNYEVLYDGQGQPIAPDAKDGSGNWLFVPQHNGQDNDRNLITAYAYDQASRRISITDPMGNLTTTTYLKEGQVKSITDPEEMVTQYRYDGLRRRTRVVQGYVVQGSSDSQEWTWDATDERWEYPTNNPVAHGTNNDQNIIVDVTYDKAGRVLSQRDPRGNVTTYQYDLLDRRKALTNPTSQNWSTAYADLTGGKTRVTLTYPGVNGGASYLVQRDFDRLGRLASIQYGSPATTPDVKFTFDGAGNRVKMSEYSSVNFTNRIRETSYGFDEVRRLTSVGFDDDGDGTADETVSYEYDAGGLRTKLTLPGSLNVIYTYDARGQLVSLTDWDNQPTQFAYDLAGRHIATERANGLRSRYQHDAAGRLRLLRHTKGFKTLGHFEYQVDKRGNRTQTLEVLPHPVTTADTIIAYDDKGIVVNGAWSEVAGFKESTAISASLRLLFFGENRKDALGVLGSNVVLTMGTGPDHGIYDVYISGSLWQSFDGHAASAGQLDILIEVHGDGPHLLEIRNRSEKNSVSTGNKVRFKQVVVADKSWTLHTIRYAYDSLSRLLEVRYAPGINGDAGDADLLRRYQFTFDRAGNRLSEAVALNGGTPTVMNYSYNAANQLTGDGTNTYEYDPNGNLWKTNGVETHTWDKANRLTSAGGAAYTYDGEGHRVSQTVSGVVTQYLLDVQPGLAVVLAATQSVDMTRYVHSLRGIHAQKDALNNWEWMVQDGLGSVRGVVSNAVDVLESRLFEPYGEPFGSTGTNQTPYGFTGEPTDANGLLYLRARYYSPNLGVFTSLDPFEGIVSRPMSLNGYSWVEGNVPNATDASGKVVSLEKIRNRETFYSCRCGWIDLEHANPIHALNLMRTVKNALNPQIYTSSPNCTGVTFQTRLGTWTGYQMATGNAQLYGLPQFANLLPWYFIPRNNSGLDWYMVSAQIYSDLVQEFELQEVSAWLPEARASGQSVEDLPSYAIAFYAAYRLEQSGMADTFYISSDQLGYLRDTIFQLDFMRECVPILDPDENERIYNLEPDSARSNKNDRFIPVDRPPELNERCAGISSDSTRIPMWLGLTSLNLHTSYNYRKQDGRQGCDSQAIKLPYPNDPDNPADRDLPESLLLYKCGGC